jgi:precorrin-6B methylase 2/DNA-binding HxlR family transcriptional regulator
VQGLANHDPADELFALINAGWTTQLIRTACVLQLPDRIANGTGDVAALAAAAACDPGALARMLRAMASIGLCEANVEQHYHLTPMGERLRAEAPESLHHWALHAGGPLWQRLGEMPESIRTGRSWPERHHGQDGYARLATDAGAERVFHRAMVELTRQAVQHIVLTLKIGTAGLVVDVGGGSGELLGAVLARSPAAQGVLFDQASALADAPRVLERAGVAQRCRITAGDFFIAAPEGGDLYLLKSVLHNWDDEHCRVILRHCAQAMASHGRLVVIERVVPQAPGSSAHHQATARTDMNMAVSLGGRERRLDEYTQLFADTGLVLAHVPKTTAEWSLLEVQRA